MIVPPLTLRGLGIQPPVVLAPMAGLTHTAFRRLVRELGGQGLLFTEMLSARRLPGQGRGSPFLSHTPIERPLAFQLLVGHPADVPPAIDTLHRLDADVVDINLGCPAPQARRCGGGAWLAARPTEAAAVVAAARRCTDKPLTAKIRLGRSLDEARLRELCRVLEGEGIDGLAVHGRLQREPYGRPARWDWIGRVRSWVSVPVVGNGGVAGTGDARQRLAEAGCHGVMVGRAVAERPWLLAGIGAALAGGRPPARPPRRAVYARFVELLRESFAPDRRLGRLKEFTHHFSRSYAFGHRLAWAVQAASTLDAAVDAAEAFFDRNAADAESDP